MSRLHGRVAIITGAAAGLGKAMAVRFAAESASLVLADRDDTRSVIETIEASGGVAIGTRTDVASPEDVDHMIETAMQRFGKIDILVNNAAIASTLVPRPFEEIDLSEWSRVLNVNIMGTVLPCRAVSPIMRGQGYGRILNFGSNTAVRGAPNLLQYVASKGAVQALSMSLAQELGGDGITVNVIAPGYIETDNNLANSAMVDNIRELAARRRAISRPAVPDDIVETALFLVSEGAGFVSSQVIVVNGGPA
jgi:NAD(P)-dependent dehydrogenase (short-subunit alcohol dehydrogenase family)